MRVLAVVAASWPAVFLPTLAEAHGFDERYDLPAPLSYFVVGASLTVALTFVAAAVFARRAPDSHAQDVDAAAKLIAYGPWLPALQLGCRISAFALFGVVLGAALWGTADPMMNLAPTLVWIIWWIGFSLLVACVGNPWPVIDPWRTLFDAFDALAQRLGRQDGIALGWVWPRALGAWPAVALLLAWSWLEVVYPLAAVPFRLGCAMLLWSVLTLTGMLCFGREAWQRNADVFAIYFDTLGRMAPLANGQRGRNIALRAPGAALINVDSAAPAGVTGFIIAMLATVLFDGLHGGQAWLLLEALLKRTVPQWMDLNGYFAGTVGLVGVWLLFFCAYQLTCLVTARVTGATFTTSSVHAAQIARRFAPTLVPIAVAYIIAHNFSSLLIQGQNAIALLSDPFGRRWDLFGTANRHVNIGIIDAQWTWYVAVAAIVGGHVLAVWLAHRVALRDCATPRRAALASLPLTLLMVVYTAISLSVIAEPMVTFEGPRADPVPVAR